MQTILDLIVLLYNDGPTVIVCCQRLFMLKTQFCNFETKLLVRQVHRYAVIGSSSRVSCNTGNVEYTKNNKLSNELNIKKTLSFKTHTYYYSSTIPKTLSQTKLYQVQFFEPTV